MGGSGSPRSEKKPEGTDELLRENESLRSRLAKLSEASLRINESLDFDTVLQVVLDSARTLTEARFGVITILDEAGRLQDFLSSGMTQDEADKLWGMGPEGLVIFEYLGSLQTPLRVPDLVGHIRSVGLPDLHPPVSASASLSFLSAPVSHRGERAGTIFLAAKESEEEFSLEDEETLVLFASQAALVVSNARTHREEQQVRADLEALINISPVAVLVFDGKSGDLISFNAETKRMVGELNSRGRSQAQLLEVMSLRTTDGSVIPEDEQPIRKALKTGEAVIANEIVIHPHDGRPPITTLFSARPIHGENGDIVSVVATIQDITPLEEMKRRRARFLNDVSHDLRTPLTAIKGSVSTLLTSPQPFDQDETRQFLRVIDEQSNHMRHLINDLVDLTHIEAGTLSITPETTELTGLLDQARESHVHLTSPSSTVELDVPPDLPRVMADKTRILQVLGNILQNIDSRSSDHSTIRIVALHRDEHVAITAHQVRADSPAPPPEWHFEALSSCAFEDAARRNGEDQSVAVCRGIVEAHGGRLASHEANGGIGSGFTFTIPVADQAAEPAGHEPAGPVSTSSNDGGRGRVLVIAENPETSRYIHRTLTQEAFATTVTGDPEEAERLVAALKPHVVLLETSLPWADGFEMLARVSRISEAPVIFVSGHGWDRQIARVFNLGAFDYIAKPFTTTELVARMDVAVQRGKSAGWRAAFGHYVHDGLYIDYADRKVTVSDRPVNLTATEYKLLTELSTSSGRVLTHDQLLRRVWGPLYTGDARVVRQYIKQVRHKLGDDATRPKYIFTEPGVGYRMAKPSIN